MMSSSYWCRMNVCSCSNGRYWILSIFRRVQIPLWGYPIPCSVRFMPPWGRFGLTSELCHWNYEVYIQAKGAMLNTWYSLIYFFLSTSKHEFFCHCFQLKSEVVCFFSSHLEVAWHLLLTNILNVLYNYIIQKWFYTIFFFCVVFQFVTGCDSSGSYSIILHSAHLTTVVLLNTALNSHFHLWNKIWSPKFSFIVIVYQHASFDWCVPCSMFFLKFPVVTKFSTWRPHFDDQSPKITRCLLKDYLYTTFFFIQSWSAAAVSLWLPGWFWRQHLGWCKWDLYCIYIFNLLSLRFDERLPLFYLSVPVFW